MDALQGDLTPDDADTHADNAPNGAETGENGVSERDYEAEARAMGWQPATEFKGDPAKCVDAKTFVERGETMLPFIKKELADTKRELSELKRTTRQFAKFAEGAEKRAYERAVADLEAKHAEAVETGDVRAAKQAVDEIRALERPEAAKDEDGLPDPQARSREWAAWLDDNDWYLTDQARRAYADAQGAAMGDPEAYEGGRTKWLADLSAKVTRKFADPKPNPVNGGGNRQPAAGGRTFSDLPAAAKVQCERFMKSIPGFTRDEYVKNYSWD